MAKKMKFKSAEEKRRYEENQRQWEQLQAKYAPKKPLRNVKLKTPVVSGVFVRATENIKSRVTAGGSTAMKQTPHYTGTSIIGIGVAHKSCLQPIFSDEAAKELASMRR